MDVPRSARPLSRDAVKLLAVFFMLLDHIVWFFLPFTSPVAQVFHTLGRITAPVMCFFLAQGVRRTGNIRRYLLRLLVFAVLAQAPWWFLHRDKAFSLNMLFTLFLCLLMLYIDQTAASPALRICGILLCVAATAYCDWAFYAPAWCLIFYHCRENRRKTLLLYTAVAAVYFFESWVSKIGADYSMQQALHLNLFTLGVLVAPGLLALCNQKKNPSRLSKWFFYVFYPLHLAVLALLKALIPA